MLSAATITAPPPARTPHLRRQGPIPGDNGGGGGDPGESERVHHSEADAFATIWNSDCVYFATDLAQQVACFTSEAFQQGRTNYATFVDPSLTFLSFVQTTSSASDPSQSTSTTVNESPSTFSDVLPASTSTGTSQSSTSSSSSSHSPNVGAIAGGVIGGVALLALAAAAFLLLRRRKRRHAAPSAEFMHMARGASPTFSTKHGEAGTSMNGDHMPLARQSSLEEEGPPPAFSPGSFKDPVFEKVSASAALREQYGARDVDVEGSYKDEGGYKD